MVQDTKFTERTFHALFFTVPFVINLQCSTVLIFAEIHTQFSSSVWSLAQRLYDILAHTFA
jgi:hypothetical protein